MASDNNNNKKPENPKNQIVTKKDHQALTEFKKPTTAVAQVPKTPEAGRFGKVHHNAADSPTRKNDETPYKERLNKK